MVIIYQLILGYSCLPTTPKKYEENTYYGKTKAKEIGEGLCPAMGQWMVRNYFLISVHIYLDNKKSRPINFPVLLKSQNNNLKVTKFKSSKSVKVLTKKILTHYYTIL